MFRQMKYLENKFPGDFSTIWRKVFLFPLSLKNSQFEKVIRLNCFSRLSSAIVEFIFLFSKLEF